MARTLLSLLLLLLSSLQVFANHFPQLVVRGGLSDNIATPTPTPKLFLRQFSNTTSTTTSDEPEDSPTPIPDTTTQIPAFIAPTTVVSGTAETTAAKQIAPALWLVWNNRNLLNDDNTKQQYIDLVDQTKNDVENLFNNLADKVDPPSVCGQTSLKKRSLISGALDLLKSAASLISCADQVVGNLANAVKGTTPDIDVVSLLTDTLADIKTQLDNLDDNNDDDNNQSTKTDDDSTTSDSTTSDSTTASSSSSSCTASSVTDCRINLFESTTFFVTDGTTTSSVTTSSSTSCQTITACSAVPTTETTVITTATTVATSSDPLCDVNNCAGNECPFQTGTPQASSKRRRDVEVSPVEEMSPLKKRLLKFFNKSAKAKRSMPDSPANVGSYVVGLTRNPDGSANTATELDWNFLSSPVVTGHGRWGTNAIAPWITGVAGCTAIVVTSKRGYWFTHIIETGFRDPAQGGSAAIWQQSLNDLQNGASRATTAASLTGVGDILEQTPCNDVRMYVMSKLKPESYDPDTDTDIPAQKVYETQVNQIIAMLTTDNGAPLTRTTLVDTYYNEVPGEETASGKVVIEYDPTGLQSDNTQAAYRVWLEGNQYPAIKFPAPQANGKRGLNARQDDQACPISNGDSSTTAGTGTTTAPVTTTALTNTGLTTTGLTTTDLTTTSADDITSTTPAPNPTVSISCSNPSLEDGDGLCTCQAWDQTTTVTPDGGPGNSCPQTISNFPTGSPPTTTSVPTTTAPPPVVTAWRCSNPSLEDGDGICTCNYGQDMTTTITPDGGPGNDCPTAMPTTTAAPPPTSTAPPPYSPTGVDSDGNVDKCHVHLWEHLLCDNDDATNLGAVAQIWDAAGNQILAPTDEVTINANEGGHAFESPLLDDLVVTGEHKGDYVQFTLGGLSWTSKDSDRSQPAYCNEGKWDMLSDSFWGCSCDDPDCPGVRQMDCWFSCPYNP